MNTIEELDKKECSGCSSCFQKCPKNAIIMKENEEGFLYPIIDKDKCINCGLCSKVCPILKNAKREGNDPKAFVMYNKNKEEILSSSSGGIFSVIANYVLENNGVVFGAAYDKELNVNHIKVSNKNELRLLRKSKYVQSNINNTYKMAEEELKNNKLVLFTGTPYQVDGLKSYLTYNYENLITCDLVCHGVPSPKAFKNYLSYLEKMQNSKIESYDFRSKDILDYEKLGKVIYKNGSIQYLKIGTDCYYNNFLVGNLFRESCYKCKYSNMNRVGDLTIGDFLGVHEVQPNLYNRNGISICIVNTNKGQELLNKLDKCFKKDDISIEKIIKYNSNLKYPVTRPCKRDTIYQNINDNELFIRDLNNSMNKKLKLKSLIPIKLKKFLKRIGV